MLHLLWMVPVLPLAGFLVLALAGRRFPRHVVSAIGVGSVAAAAFISILIACAYIATPARLAIDPPQIDENAFTQTLWTWIPFDGVNACLSFHLDHLSLLMILVVSVVATLILIYSVRFMADDAGYSRFFAWMDLFVASMLVLVLAGDLLLLYVGWEGVGLCSFLLIGFWYRDPANVRAARKAFIVTRVGDVALLVGIILLANHFGTLNIADMGYGSEVGAPFALAAALLLLGGALGKSAQLPLQTWLPDAMAGPTPVSALIHAATMVTAGVYLIARMHRIFALAPVAMTVVAVIGAATLLLAGFAALVQRDIKRVLAYSTMSQVGFMFLALGVGAWSAAIFHFATHAFFKALLFMAAGVVILALKGEHDIFKMGGLRRILPGTFWMFLAGAASLAAVPFVTAGFYSKDAILISVFFLGDGNRILWCAGLLGGLLTSLYIFRVFFMVFFGEERAYSPFTPGLVIAIPLAILAFLSLFGAGILNYVEFPSPMYTVMFAAFPSQAAERALGVVSGIVSLGGILLAWMLFTGEKRFVTAAVKNPFGAALHRLWLSGWGFDRVYGALFVAPFVWLARLNRGDFIDSLYATLAWFCRAGYELLSDTQTGNVRWYAVGIVVGAIIIIAIVVLL